MVKLKEYHLKHDKIKTNKYFFAKTKNSRNY